MRIAKLLVLVLCISVLTFISVKAQPKDSIGIAPIPYKMTWFNSPVKYSFKNGVLAITAGPKTDMFRDPNVTYNTDNAPKLLFTPDEDFVFSASIQHSFTYKWDGGAIVLIEDSLNWVKFCFEKDYTGARRVVSVVTKDISDDCNSVAIISDKVFYKLAKAANVLTLYYSVDGRKWFLIRHLQFNNKKNLKIGFLVQSPTGEKCEVKFSNIHYSATTIKDPYLGE